MRDKKKKAPAACCRAMADNYEPVRILGAGGQGIVFLCLHKASGSLVACKTSLSHYHEHHRRKDHTHKSSIKSKLSLLVLSARRKTPRSKESAIHDEQGHDEELQCEIDMMQIARGHPNILALDSTFESEDGFVHLVTPFCEGGSLLDKLQHDLHGTTPSKSLKPLLDNHRAAKIIASLASALSYCHALGIVHRDVKLGNIFVHRKKEAGADDEDDVVLGDFGTATIISQTEKLSYFAGTKMYMAPEVKQRSYDHRIDVWSLGIVLHVLLSGAFLGDDFRIHASIHDYQACDLLLGMLCVDPTKRLTMKQVLSHPWIVKNTCKQPEAEKQVTIINSPFATTSTATGIELALKSCKQVLLNLGRAKHINGRADQIIGK